MTAYTLTAAQGSYASSGVFSGVNNGLGFTDLIHRTLVESQWVVNNFNRWSENNTNGLTVTYRNQPSGFGRTKYYGLE